MQGPLASGAISLSARELPLASGVPQDRTPFIAQAPAIQASPHDNDNL